VSLTDPDALRELAATTVSATAKWHAERTHEFRSDAPGALLARCGRRTWRIAWTRDGVDCRACVKALQRRESHR
jgi:hypothetical protein